MIILAIIIKFRTKLTAAPDGPILAIVSVVSFVMSIFWIWLFSNILIDLLNVLGLLTGLPTTLLGFTLLAWGNSIGDFMANTAIAKKGFLEMALTGCYAGPLFNILVGLGIPLIRMNIFIEGHNGIRFSYQDVESAIPLVLMVGTIVGLLFTLIMTTIINKNVITKT